MKNILFNLVLVQSMEYCKAHNIDCSGSHLMKYPRQWIYALIKDETGKAIITTSLYKSRTPCITVHK